MSQAPGRAISSSAIEGARRELFPDDRTGTAECVSLIACDRSVQVGFGASASKRTSDSSVTSSSVRSPPNSWLANTPGWQITPTCFIRMTRSLPGIIRRPARAPVPSRARPARGKAQLERSLLSLLDVHWSVPWTKFSPPRVPAHCRQTHGTRRSRIASAKELAPGVTLPSKGVYPAAWRCRSGNRTSYAWLPGSIVQRSTRTVRALRYIDNAVIGIFWAR